MGAWETYKLGDLAKHVKERYPVSALTLDNYISTENVLPNRGGRVTANTLPQAGNVVAWRTDDVLVPNIRPYFKKIWRGQGVGGASADVMVIRVRDEQKILPRLLYYYLSSDAFFAHVMAGANGAKMPRGNRTYTMQFELSLPSLEEQERITGILGAYDDLIAVNERRMALLEEAAHRLYRDRFVTHVNPTWPLRPLGEVAEFTMGQSPESRFYNTERKGLPFHQGVGTFGVLFPKEEVYSSEYSRTAQPGDILFSVRAPVGRINIADKNCALGRGLSAIRSRSGHQTWLFLALKNLFIKENMIGNGAIFASVTKDDLSNVEILAPPSTVVADSNNILSPYFEAIGVLARENALLREGRDKLLPRLLREEA